MRNFLTYLSVYLSCRCSLGALEKADLALDLLRFGLEDEGLGIEHTLAHTHTHTHTQLTQAQTLRQSQLSENGSLRDRHFRESPKDNVSNSGM